MDRFDPSKVIVLTADARIGELPLTEANVCAAINSALARAEANTKLTQALAPVGPDNQPRMLHVTAWIAHADVENKNGYVFPREGLEAAVKNGLFKPPFFGMMDFNHNYEAYGVWYDAEFAYDDDAGAWGILAHGALFAWRYSDLADKMVAEQDRGGAIKLSIGAVYKTATISENPDTKRVRLTVHDPVILACSLLDVDPADVDARGVVSELLSEMPERRMETLRAQLEGVPDHSEDDDMDLKELTAKIEELLGEKKEDLQPLVEAALKLPAVEAEVKRLTDEFTALTSGKAALENEKATLEVGLDAMKKELATANEELSTLRAFKAEIEQKEQERVEAEKRTAREKEIPEAVLASVKERQDGESLLNEWLGQADEQWAKTKATFEIVTASAKKSLADLSREEGFLSTQADRVTGDDAISEFIKSK